MARAAGAPELVRRGLPRSTAYQVLAGRRPSAETAALIATIIGDTDSATPPRSCARPGCDKPPRGRGRWCSPGCRKAVWRAKRRLAAHAVGGRWCRRCDTVRFGDLRVSCPVCENKDIVEVRAVQCATCGTLRVGDLTDPCPGCKEKAAR
jgi:hypothetical protein